MNARPILRELNPASGTCPVCREPLAAMGHQRLEHLRKHRRERDCREALRAGRVAVWLERVARKLSAARQQP